MRYSGLKVINEGLFGNKGWRPAWRDPALWRRLQKHGMARDSSWAEAAGHYAALYKKLAG